MVWTLIKIAVVLFIIMLFLIKPGKRRDTSYFKTKMYAHRGLHGAGVPENSLTAFRLARESGYGVELDVQMTKDRKLVVFHDGSLKRMCGVDGYLRDYTYDELCEFRLAGTDERIPLFEDVLKTLGKTDLICEIKATTATNATIYADTLTKRFVTTKDVFASSHSVPILCSGLRRITPR